MEPTSPLAPGAKSSSSSIVKPKPFFTRVSYSLRLWILQFIVKTMSRYRRFRKPLPASYTPTVVKYYPGPLQSLENRIFVPPNLISTKALPVFFSVHGGGFVLGSPANDDEFNANLARKSGFIVVSINYRKAPRWKFPTAVRDVAQLVGAVLKDKDLNIDVTRVAIGGFSAGGNLSLAVSQLPELKDTVKAAVALYPPLTFELSVEEKLASRPYRNDTDKDRLGPLMELFDWAYIEAGTDASNPLLSVSNADRKDLPKWCFVIAAEWDMLGNEARVMMERLMDEKELGYEFEKGSLRFAMMKGCYHGFTNMKLQGSDEVVRIQAVEKCLDDITEWLWNGAFA